MLVLSSYSLCSATSLVLCFTSSSPGSDTFTTCAYSFPSLSSVATVETRVCALLLVFLNSTSLLLFSTFFSPFTLFFGGETNQVCEVFYASPAESTLVLLPPPPPLLIRKCDSAACKYIADWANLQGSLLHLAQPVGAGTTWYSGKGGEGRQEGSKGEIWNRYTISL